jgi:phosphoglycolate phosphatase
MKYKAVIWDLDGTLLDTLEDLMNSVNYGLESFDLPPITLDMTRRFVGNGVGKLIERAVPAGTEKATEEAVLAKFKAYYEEHSLDKTRPYEGVLDVLRHLKGQGYKLAIVSNKIESAVGELAEKFFEGLIDVAIGETPDVPKKPAPDMIYKGLDKLGVEKDEAIFIGDSDVDVATGINSGLDMITVLWGFRDEDELVEAGAKVFVRKPEEILEKLS